MVTATAAPSSRIARDSDGNIDIRHLPFSRLDLKAASDLLQSLGGDVDAAVDCVLVLNELQPDLRGLIVRDDGE